MFSVPLWVYSFKSTVTGNFIVFGKEWGSYVCSALNILNSKSLYVFYEVTVSIEIILLKQLVFWKLQLNKLLI